MRKKSLTERFRFLLPLRKLQRKFCFYLKMWLDRNRYAKTKQETLLPYICFADKKCLVNTDARCDPQLQENKIYNLKLAAKTLNTILIRPQETFSFWQLVRHADRDEPYKDGMSIENGVLVASYGGGLCQMSNSLFWMFLHTPLTIVERHTHTIRRFPYPPGDVLEGTDATVAEGWADLKMRNDTQHTFQIHLAFDENFLYLEIRTDQVPKYCYEILQKDLCYSKSDNRLWERVSIYRRQVHIASQEVLMESKLYDNQCEIGYELPDGTSVAQEEKKAYA